MGGRMTQHVESVGTVGFDRLDRGVLLDGTVEIDQLAIEAHGDDVTPARAVENLADRGPARHGAMLPVERYGNLRAHLVMNVATVNAGICSAALAAGERWPIMNGCIAWDKRARGGDSGNSWPYTSERRAGRHGRD